MSFQTWRSGATTVGRPQAHPAICVAGAGYVGLVTAACLAELGHQVVAVETNPVRLAALTSGSLPLYEPGLEPLVLRHAATGRLRFTGDYGDALRSCHIAIIAVNTPAGDEGHADTSLVLRCARQVLEYASAGLTLVVKSTVPVGTSDQIEALAREHKLPGVQVVSNPEFLRQGTAVSDFMQPDRIVIGADTRATAEDIAALYAGLDAPIVHCGRRSAELAKYVSNALLATRVSFMNEVAAICDATEADVEDISHIVGLDHRIGRHYLTPGLGWGGSCLPKDVQALAATARQQGFSPRLLEAVASVNGQQPGLALRRLADLGQLRAGAVVGLLGLSFKPDTDDIRGAPSLAVIAELLEAGMKVRAHDPAATHHVKAMCPQVSCSEDLYTAVQGTDALVVCTEWEQYRHADWQRIAGLVRRMVVLDGRNFLDGDALVDLGFSYIALGRQARFANSRHPAHVTPRDRSPATSPRGQASNRVPARTLLVPHTEAAS